MRGFVRRLLAGKRKPVLVEVDDWLLVPFRYAEAARLSVYTIANQDNIPDDVRAWIAEWLFNYNTELAAYMRLKYGEGVFPLLDAVTREVWPSEDGGGGDVGVDTQPMPKPVVVDQETWVKWEQELGGNHE